MANTTSGVQRTSETIPSWSQPPPPGSRVTFFLRATPPVFTVVSVAQSNQDFVIAGIVQEIQRRGLDQSRTIPAPRINGFVQVSGLNHNRTLGSPKVNPQVRITGLDHAKALGSIVVVPPPVVPPTPDPGPAPAEPVHTPRNLRYVRRRNRPERN